MELRPPRFGILRVPYDANAHCHSGLRNLDLHHQVRAKAALWKAIHMSLDLGRAHTFSRQRWEPTLLKSEVQGVNSGCLHWMGDTQVENRIFL